MDGGAQEHAESTRIKKAVKEYAIASRKRKRTDLGDSNTTRESRSCSVSRKDTRPSEETPLQEDPEASRVVQHESTIDLTSTPTSAIYQEQHIDGLQTPLEVDVALSALASPASAGASDTALQYREAELLMHYFDHVFPLQFRFYRPDVRSRRRGWLLWLLMRTGPLHHAALSLSALHEHIVLSPNDDDLLSELMGYHAKAIQELRGFIQESREHDPLANRRRQIEVLACGVLLISFELFQGGVSDWAVHLNALTSIVSLQESARYLDSANRASVSIKADEDSIKNRQPELHVLMEDAASHFLVTVILWFDLLAGASTGQAPCLPYTALLDSGDLDLEKVMGCQNWVMVEIGEIATLHAWKRQEKDRGALSIRELVERSQFIERRIEHGLAVLNNMYSRHYRGSGSSAGLAIEEHSVTDSSTADVTKAFASAALVYLHTTVSGAFPNLPEIRSAVSRTLSALQAVPDLQQLRGLVWPICIAGCMAEPDCQSLFEELVIRVLRPTIRDFGNCATVLSIMQRCWEMRQTSATVEADWQTAMDGLGVQVLLV